MSESPAVSGAMKIFEGDPWRQNIKRQRGRKRQFFNALPRYIFPQFKDAKSQFLRGCLSVFLCVDLHELLIWKQKSVYKA